MTQTDSISREALSPPYIPRWGSAVLGLSSLALIVGGVAASYFLQGYFGDLSMTCLSGSAAGIALLAVTIVLTCKKRKAQSPKEENYTHFPTHPDDQKDGVKDKGFVKTFNESKKKIDNQAALLEKKNEELRDVIRRAPQIVENVGDYVAHPQNYALGEVVHGKSLFTPVHQLFDGFYLGNLSAYFSVDPDYVKNYDVVEPLKDIREYGIPITRNEHGEMAKGASGLGIKYVVSVTGFESNVKEENHWSKFVPNLDELGIARDQIKAPDTEKAWKKIEPELRQVFKNIDQARLEGRNVLVHCVEGSSRSSAVVYAYLMSRCRVTLAEAFNFVRSKRAHVQIKPEMYAGLQEYEQKLIKAGVIRS